MKNLVWLLKWILKAAIFFTLFAFALNNQHEGAVRFFFGTEWRAPMVLVVLAAFALGLALGVVAMAPRWWRQRHAARGMVVEPPAPAPTVPPLPAEAATDTSLGNVPRHGL
ncbi:lipopolysaccharide assembly protein LapA domain-containing protein [Pseudorhodoferax sp. LjRoot39]|jgi:putative membrane protein|uniref:lipopolysaccharide assembly protein LapA domain-containing protein n=1 Tax=Pseudorhodoferax sp. LjRoot39 TaxID=3342328 RepID=UPI003ECCB566